MDQVSEVREKIDIVSLIQEYIPLKKAGANYKALCPFHTDKTPSMVVSPERQIWHCFGCGKGGDCFSFLMEYEHIEFPEALRILAQKAGVTLLNQRIDHEATSKKEKIYQLNHLAAEFYHYLLTKHELGKEALSYVKNRGVKEQTMNTYMLGFSPRGKSLVTYLHKKKHYSLDDIFEAGLATKYGRDMVDFFQGRLMFPLYDHRGNIIGFSGRVLDQNEKISKYINTRETLVYHKGLTFFGLNMAKESMKKEGSAILMEGEFDVISSFQEGITNAVAVKGTALTENQVSLLSRFCKKVKLCFDADHAGQDALKRSLPILERKGMTTTVVIIASGKDADEAIKADPIGFKKAIGHDIGAYDYLLEKAEKENDVNSAEGKSAIADTMLPLLNNVENEIVKEHYLQLLSKSINTSVDNLTKAMGKLQKERVVRDIPTVIVPTTSREEKLEEYLVAIIIQSPFVSHLLGVAEEFFNEYVWRIPSFGKIVSHVAMYLAAHPQGLAKDTTSSLPQELLVGFNTCFLLPLPSLSGEEQWEHELKRTVKELETITIKEKMKEVSKGISEKEKTGEQEDVAKLQEEFTKLAQKLAQKG